MYTEAQRRAHIYDLQRFLRRIQREHDHPQPLVPDGIYGPETAAAVRDFQRHNGLPVTGTVDFATWTLLFKEYSALTRGDTLPSAVSFFPAGAHAKLSLGDKGPSVCALQLMLNTAIPHFSNLSPLSLTGEYDHDTAEAVRRAQQAFQLPTTGEADRATWDALARFHNHYFDHTPLAWRLAEAEQ
ncbi:MAG: peptidoglycan-binding protein [Eubacteriales bacterium]|nr:peptidoglycan-binding protein [Eubacteriales bacterium]